ncbi:MAG: ABC transporter ATP-binding protein [Alphaproteobacteria bacterium HGW-Alphaproteobacteria-2]|nr:MAG: ABC transporter ATP-binding protein [Alphaproteobacteria bacterium HGW-Alphaproteobacteria-2]
MSSDVTSNPLVSDAALEVRGLRLGYGATEIVKGVDIAARRGAVTTIIGPNGSGKSTLIRGLAGLLRPLGGSIWLEGRDLTALPAVRRVAEGVGYVPQEANIFRNLGVAENLRLATEFVPGRQSSARERDEILALFPDLAVRGALAAGRLSGGQRQMLAMACALLARPSILLLDEPSAGLSPRLVAETMQTVREVCDRGVSILMIEQNVAAALPVSDQVVVLVAGRVRLQSAADRLLVDHNLHRLYLGEAA